MPSAAVPPHVGYLCKSLIAATKGQAVFLSVRTYIVRALKIYRCVPSRTYLVALCAVAPHAFTLVHHPAVAVPIALADESCATQLTKYGGFERLTLRDTLLRVTGAYDDRVDYISKVFYAPLPRPWV
eukprot:gb/GEZJ01009489.1/.p2 GENE.gb/GEZJ01009489.1/~~gb/GEZJ01009489.1/.p2  ORF type:complete len:127 (-),score=8.00 gb/GEZJ01009489.1/:274-654(-)